MYHSKLHLKQITLPLPYYGPKSTDTRRGRHEDLNLPYLDWQLTMPNWRVPEHSLPQKKWAKPSISRTRRQATPSKIGGRDINNHPKDHWVLASCWTFRSGSCSFISSKSLCCTSAPGPGPNLCSAATRVTLSISWKFYLQIDRRPGRSAVDKYRLGWTATALGGGPSFPDTVARAPRARHVHLSHRRTELSAEPIDHLDHLDPILDEIGLVNGIHYKIFASQTARQPRNLRPLSQVWLFR